MLLISETKDYKFILEDCYSSDKEFLDKYHDTPGAGLDHCVGRDVSLFENIENFKMFDVSFNNMRVGYFGIDANYEPPFLLGFFVKPGFRGKDYLHEFWNKIKENFPGDFLGACSPNNTKAIKYLLNRGGENFLQSKNLIILKFKN